VSRQDDEPDLLFPFDTRQTTSTGIQCPECGNNGMDGSITGQSGQWGIKRICKKCDHEWHGGIGVQRADFSEPIPRPGVAPPAYDDIPIVQYTGAAYRDPSKNFSGDE
jgi:hypothetical protein